MLPAVSTLLPPRGGAKEHPPIRLTLNTEALNLLREQAQAYSHGENPARPVLNVSLADGEASIRLNGLEFHGTQCKETDHVEIFCPSSSSGFESRGRVATKVTVKQAVKPKSVRELDLAHPAVQKIIELLAIRAQTAAALAKKTNEPPNIVAAALERVATRNPSNAAYELKPEFCGAAAAPSPPLSDESMQQDELLHIKKRKPRSASVEPEKRLKREQDEDMYELARKFRDQYNEYRELYALLQHRKSRPPQQLRRLMALHNQLASWKEKLWSRSRQVK